ncbi:MAG TPA: hypothetical protein PK208_03520 [Fibrobacteria bacterium]|nr:hypothetical protein [Fibrobacteria bacterium]
MITPLASLAAAALSSSTPNRTVELSDPRLLVSGSAISSVTADGDTAYIVAGNTVKKVVYGSDLRVVDSLPKRGGQTWGMSKYVNLGDGLGILALANTISDTAFWLVDWKATSNTALFPFETGSRWAKYQGLGFAKVAAGYSNYGFSEESNLVGVGISKNLAIFAGDKGIFHVGANRDQTGGTSLSVNMSKSDSGRFLWSDVSLATNLATGSTMPTLDFAGNSWGKKVKFMHSPYAVEDLGWLKHVDSSFGRSPDNSSAWQWGFNLASGTGKCWLHVSRTTRQALHNCVVDGKLEQDTMLVPSLGKDSVAYQHQVLTARSASGLSLLAGDSILAFYDWDGYRLPVPAGTLTLNKATTSADFGDSTFWHVSGKELRAFNLKGIVDPTKPANEKGIIGSGTAYLYWTAPESTKAFFVQVEGEGIDTSIYTTSRSAEIRIDGLPIAARAASVEDSIRWRVADAKGLGANASSTSINSLDYSAWQLATSGTAGVTRIPAFRRAFDVRSSPNGLVITSNGILDLEVIDAGGRRIGNISTTGSAPVEFRTLAKGLLLVRGADQALKLTRF